MTALMLAMAAGALFYLQPVLSQPRRRLPPDAAGRCPGRLLLAAAVAVGLAWAVDQGVSRFGFWHHALER